MELKTGKLTLTSYLKNVADDARLSQDGVIYAFLTLFFYKSSNYPLFLLGTTITIFIICLSGSSLANSKAVRIILNAIFNVAVVLSALYQGMYYFAVALSLLFSTYVTFEIVGAIKSRPK